MDYESYSAVDLIREFMSRETKKNKFCLNFLIVENKLPEKFLVYFQSCCKISHNVQCLKKWKRQRFLVSRKRNEKFPWNLNHFCPSCSKFPQNDTVTLLLFWFVNSCDEKQRKTQIPFELPPCGKQAARKFHELTATQDQQTTPIYILCCHWWCKISYNVQCSK